MKAALRPNRIALPTTRPLKVYAFDPSRGRYLGNVMTLTVPYERVQAGPTGARIAVVDYDATNRCFYDPVNLEDTRILLQGGLDPSESDLHFHQQMLYAVVMETVQHFESALGRHIHWRRGDRLAKSRKEAQEEDIWVLKLYPHAMAQANAFYSPQAHGILFGYFRASETNPGRNLPGQTVFTCLSHDIIVHETTHAVIDGMRTYFTDPTNIDVPAFHEGFADLAALFRHFSHKEVLIDAIGKTGGRLFDTYLQPAVTKSASGPGGEPPGPSIQAQIAQRNPLVEMARQFGDAAGRNAGLRSALGTPPDPKDYAEKEEPHDRGSVLVAAVFDAYFTVYLKRTGNLFQLYRAGGGSTRADVPGPLADLLAAEASRTAEEFFSICVRALDYCPPVDIRFGDYLRAIITAHSDLHPTDEDGIREAFMQAFRLRGIVPEDAEFFSEDALCWPTAPQGLLPPVEGLLFGDANDLTRDEANVDGNILRDYARKNARVLGFDPGLPVDAPSFHPVFRVDQNGRLHIDMVVELAQTREVPFEKSAPELGRFPLRGGATLVIPRPRPRDDGRSLAHVRYLIAKHLHGAEGELRTARQREFYERSGLIASDPRGKMRFQIDFAVLHRGF